MLVTGAGGFTRLRATLDWEPEVSIEEGLACTYRWIEVQLRKREQAKVPLADPLLERQAVATSP